MVPYCFFRQRRKRRRLYLPELGNVEMAFGAAVARDEAWERSYVSLLEKHASILEESDALLIAANGLISAGSVNALMFAQQCLAWALERYPSDALAVATCRWWTAGEEDSTRQAPYRVINNTLRPSGRKTAASLDLVMPAVCLLTWALENLPKTPEFARKPAAVYRVVAWLFPNPQHYDPKAHFLEGTVMTTYDFRSASRSLAIAANQNFSKPRWVGEELEDKGHYLLLADLLPGVSLDDIVLEALADPSKRKGHIEDSRYDYELKDAVRTTSASGFSDVNADCAEARELFLTDTDSGKVIRGFPTPFFATHFVIENALISYMAPLSYFPEEDEVLFSPMSRYLVREVERNFPRNPDKVTLVYLNPECSVDREVTPAAVSSSL
eukprot:RCo019327